MSPSHSARFFRCAVSAPLLTLAMAAMLLSAATVPHVHVGSEPGFYNQEHDLSYLATLGGVGPLPQTATLFVGVAVLPGVAVAAGEIASEPRRHSDSRAPPIR